MATKKKAAKKSAKKNAGVAKLKKITSKAKTIRKKGEKWTTAVKRAAKLVK